MKKMISLEDRFDMSPEGQLKRVQKAYQESKENPENMSYWFPKIMASTSQNESILKVPETKIIQLDFETWHWLCSDRYTKEKIKEFNELLVKELSDFRNGETLFMKTGIFSDKFVFKYTVVDNKEDIGEKFLSMYYDSMMVGAENTSEAVFREMIPNSAEKLTIYEGMPLRTEFRVFYDYDEKKVLGISNYWHPDVMKGNLRGQDGESYEKTKEQIISDYEQYKHEVAEQVSLFMDGVTELKGKWSIDVMKNGDEFWLIDMARMEKSALIPQMETLKIKEGLMLKSNKYQLLEADYNFVCKELKTYRLMMEEVRKENEGLVGLIEQMAKKLDNADRRYAYDELDRITKRKHERF